MGYTEGDISNYYSPYETTRKKTLCYFIRSERTRVMCFVCVQHSTWPQGGTQIFVQTRNSRIGFHSEVWLPRHLSVRHVFFMILENKLDFGLQKYKGCVPPYPEKGQWVSMGTISWTFNLASFLSLH